MSIPLKSASLYDGQEVFAWSNCLLDLGMDFLVGNMVTRSLQEMYIDTTHGLCMRCI